MSQCCVFNIGHAVVSTAKKGRKQYCTGGLQKAQTFGRQQHLQKTQTVGKQ